DRFDPEGESGTDTITLDTWIRETFINNHPQLLKYKYLGAAGCNTYQLIELTRNEIIPGDPDGYCTAWCIWYLETRAKNPKLHPLHFWEHASKKLFSQDKMEGPFKDYDTACRDSIMHQWSNLERSKWPHRYGKIVLQFHFNYDGSVSDIKVLEDSVDAGQVVICQKAISSSAPFPPWPQDMKRMIGANYRVMTFTFNYYK
ncbi:MAG: hypothetical protein WCS42_06925, partial [Verrucomicrobiota bacterium]